MQLLHSDAQELASETLGRIARATSEELELSLDKSVQIRLPSISRKLLETDALIAIEASVSNVAWFQPDVQDLAG
ncbi:MAG: hypothetical protein AAF989_16265 [Planctomycetota bacterium]